MKRIKKLRTQHISIDLPTEDSIHWVNAVVQTVYKDPDTYKTIQTIDRTGQIIRSVNDVAGETVTVQDPVTGNTIQISVAGIALAIRACFNRWCIEDYNGEINEHDDIIVKE